MSKYAPVPGKIPGTDVTLSGVTLHLAPININQVKALAPLVKRLGEISIDTPLEEQMDIAVPIVYAAAARNHPDITEDDLRNLLDMGNFQEALSAAMQIGGYHKSKPGEPKATTSTGTRSSPKSSPPPAGLGSIAASN